MDNVLMCELTSFSLNTTLHYPNGEKQIVPTSELGYMLNTICKMGGINRVQFICDNAAYVEGIIDEAKLQEKETYSYNDIDYEVIT